MALEGEGREKRGWVSGRDGHPLETHVPWPTKKKNIGVKFQSKMAVIGVAKWCEHSLMALCSLRVTNTF